MAKTRKELLELLNAENGLENLKRLMETEDLPPVAKDVNNHIHTTYSFSPYSPTAAVWFARAAGLCTCGLMDHDSIAGAEEFLAAAKAAHMGATIGMECRVSFKDTPFGDKKLNNPDQNGIVYMTMHGVPHDRAAELNAYFAPYREKRNVRNRAMVRAINGMMGRYGVEIDFERDVLPLSNFAKGGSVTERHLSSALALRMLEVIGGGEKLVKFIKEELKLPISGKIEGFLLDADNPHMMYDLLGWIKSQLISRFYIDATDECPDVRRNSRTTTWTSWWPTSPASATAPSPTCPAGTPRRSCAACGRCAKSTTCSRSPARTSTRRARASSAKRSAIRRSATFMTRHGR